jgi:hypothetical protein
MAFLDYLVSRGVGGSWIYRATAFRALGARKSVEAGGRSCRCELIVIRYRLSVICYLLFVFGTPPLPWVLLRKPSRTARRAKDVSLRPGGAYAPACKANGFQLV